MSTKTPTICLNMIVKNESKIILRLLQSVLPIIDTYCICDTGSSDDTIEKIQQFFKEKNITGKIVHEPFKNFSHNRNFALQACYGMSDYVLLLDADMILDIKNFKKEEMNDFDVFHILQGNESFYYHNVRMVRNNGLFSYAGVTHEYINIPNNSKTKLFNKNELFIIDIGDGGAKSDKYERDIRLLTKGLEDEPNNERYYFYLANTYHDNGQFEKAIEIYEKRIQRGGWIQEVWFSNYKIGHCYKQMGKIHHAIYYWLECFNVLPERLESLNEIIMYYRIISKHKLAFHFCQIAKEIINKKIFRDDYLFLHNDVYTYKIDYEYSIIASYVGVKNINNEIVNILNNSNENSINNNLLNNMKFYKDLLHPSHKILVDDSFVANINNEAIMFRSSSSCLIHDNRSSVTCENSDKKYLMNIRYVNYYITENGSYKNCDKNIITINKYVELDKNLDFVSSSNFEVDFDNRMYIGVEDVKIFNDIVSDNILYMGTTLHRDGFLGIVSGNYDMVSKKMVSNELKQRFQNSQCEKNWVFVDYRGSTHIIYNWFPLQICKLNQETQNIEIVDKKEMPKIFAHVRGSSCGFKYGRELWFVVHVVSYENPRHYYHMIVVFDEEMKLLRYSAPFKFEGEPIEYCLSIVVEDERILLNYSTWDRTTRIGFYKKSYIEQMLKYT